MQISQEIDLILWKFSVIIIISKYSIENSDEKCMKSKNVKECI